MNHFIKICNDSILLDAVIVKIWYINSSVKGKGETE